MNGVPDTDARGGRLEGLLAESREAVAYSANALRSVRERFREAHAEQLGQLDRLRVELAAIDRRAPGESSARGSPGAADGTGADGERTAAAAAAEAGADDARTRVARRDEAIAAREAGAEGSALARLDLAIRSLESAWLFLGRDDASLVSDPSTSMTVTDLQMRIVEAQEAERTRLAREVHDGPAQALSNAVFQVELVERMLGRDPALAAAELRLLRELLRRELGDVRAFISQLRPPILAELGLDGAIRDSADQVAAIMGISVTAEVDPAIQVLGEAVQTVILRIVQEALQNVRRHSVARQVTIRAAQDDGQWVIEVRDDGRGFDVGAVAARGRRNFGLQSMRERAELIGARFEVRSRPDGGTVVQIAIPRGEEESR
ncbi:MAG: Histidine kinase protein [Chloroflexi bacterium]|nr:Histidine kinase protein [Chloroflexota bacterium]